MVNRMNVVGPVFGLRREIDRLFEDAFGRGSELGRPMWSPAVNVREDDRGLNFEFELPGFRPEQVEVTAENGVLTVRGERQEERKEGEQEGRYHLVERSSGSFQRSFQLPAGLDEENIEASFDNGLLEVRIPKAALPQPRKIQIRSGAQEQGRVGSGEVRGQPTAQRSASRGASEGAGGAAGSGRESSGARAASSGRPTQNG
ncbi:MAG: Hsp20/alpha crystallin family protein [Gemmatimonadaceae bacterium]